MRRKIVCSGRSVFSTNGSPAAARNRRSMRRSTTLNDSIVSCVALVEQVPLHVQHLVAVRCGRAFGGKPDDEALHVAPQAKQLALARQVDRRDLQPPPGVDDDERVGRQSGDRLVHRRASQVHQVLQLLQREVAPRPQLARDESLLDAPRKQARTGSRAPAPRAGAARARSASPVLETSTSCARLAAFFATATSAGTLPHSMRIW